MRLTPLLVAASFVVLLAVPLQPAAGGTAPIQPGAQMHNNGATCTLNFIFDGTGHLAGRVFIGTAAHCVNKVGQRITIVGHYNAGTVFYLGDTGNSINGDGRGDNGHPGQQLDFALIEITGLNHAVSAEVKGHPGWPTGATTNAETDIGDRTFFSGYGMGVSATQPTREMRWGLLYMDTVRSYTTYAPVLPGDSGGPVLHESGEALGIVSALRAGSIVGPTVQGVTAELASLGIPIQLRTV